MNTELPNYQLVEIFRQNTAAALEIAISLARLEEKTKAIQDRLDEHCKLSVAISAVRTQADAAQNARITALEMWQAKVAGYLAIAAFIGGMVGSAATAAIMRVFFK